MFRTNRYGAPGNQRTSLSKITEALSPGSQRILRETRFSRSEINRAFAAARQKVGL